MRKCVKSVAGLFLIISVILCAVIGFYYVHLPDKYYLCDNNSFEFNTLFDITADSNEDIKPVYAAQGISKDTLDLKLWGIFPIKSATAEKIERPKLIPCGTPFGTPYT